VRRITGLVIPDLQVTYKLTDLDGLNVWYESRLLEVGVEDMQNLATTDIVDLMLNTRIPVDRLIDWIDQAFLYLRIAPKPERELLRGYGIRTATDLLDVYKAHRGMGDLLPAAANGNTPSRVAALVVSLGGERNLQHVQAWKRYAVERVAEPAAVPEPEPAPDAAPVPATT